MYVSLFSTEITFELLATIDDVDATDAHAPILEIPLEIGE